MEQEEVMDKRKGDGMDSILKNGKPWCTLIQQFNGAVIVVGPKASEKLSFTNLIDAEDEIEKRGWIIGVIHPTLRNQEV